MPFSRYKIKIKIIRKCAILQISEKRENKIFADKQHVYNEFLCVNAVHSSSCIIIYRNRFANGLTFIQYIFFELHLRFSVKIKQTQKHRMGAYLVFLYPY